MLEVVNIQDNLIKRKVISIKRALLMIDKKDR